MTVVEVVEAVLKDRIFYEDSGGGVTISGGEPLSQPRFLKALVEALHTAGIHVALDTTGFGCTEHLLAAAGFSDLVLYDLKAFDETRHKKLTGVSNRSILQNLQALNEVHNNIWIRIPVVPGFNDDAEDLGKIATFIAGLRSVTLVNLLPFHRSGLHKYERLGWGHSLDGVETPSAELMELAAGAFRQLHLPTKIGG
jgi:pyruvate formate lyase activating enzyme